MLYENQRSSGNKSEPTELVDLVQELIQTSKIENIFIDQKERKIFLFKEKVPLKQFFALYAINKISSLANEKKPCR
jgi:DNA (cytosine-5)-methyltransferase 1